MFTEIFALLSNLFHVILGISTPQSFPPPLSSEVEKDYFERLEGGDTSVRNELILHNLRLVSHIVRKYYSTAKNQEDLVSIGTIGLIKAVDTFKISCGSKFATYAARCIQNEILMHFRSQKKSASEISINETIDVDRDGNPLTYIDIICCDDSFCADIERKLTSERAIKLVNTLLTERERQIIVLRYGIGRRNPLTQREVAQRLKISRSYVSRIEKTALSKLSAALKE